MNPAAACQVLVPGSAANGEALVLTQPISFWGGVDPRTSRIVDVRHPQASIPIAGRALFLPATIGSSSASAVLLELAHAGIAPAVIVMHEPDAILLLGLIVAREMEIATPMALQLDRSRHALFASRLVAASLDGTIRAL